MGDKEVHTSVMDHTWKCSSWIFWPIAVQSVWDLWVNNPTAVQKLWNNEECLNCTCAKHLLQAIPSSYVWAPPSGDSGLTVLGTSESQEGKALLYLNTWETYKLRILPGQIRVLTSQKKTLTSGKSWTTLVTPSRQGEQLLDSTLSKRKQKTM